MEGLAAFIHSLDGVLGVDSGHIHIADNACIPTLEVIAKKVSKQWGGGFYGGYFQQYIMPSNWHEEKSKHLEFFCKKLEHLLLIFKIIKNIRGKMVL